MGDVRKSATPVYFVNQILRIRGKSRQFALGVVDQQVVCRGNATHIVHLLTHQEEHLAVVALAAVDPYVVIGDDDEIQSRLRRGQCDLGMQPFAVGIAGVDVGVADVFVHGWLVC